MRILSMAALLVSGLCAAIPASAQVSSPGPVYYNTSPGTPQVNRVWDPAGPAYHNTPQNPQQFIPAPPAMTSPNPPYYNPPQARVSPNPPYRNAQPPRYDNGGGRWGGQVNGRWWGGMQAPGGWNSYRRPARGHSLPSYWLSSNFMIPDYYSFGLRAPDRGYFWVRYYDDAVMVDSRGRIYDWSDGIGWDGASAYASDGYASASSSAYASSGGGYGSGPIPSVDPNVYYGTQGGYAPPVVGAPPAVQYRCPNVCPQSQTYYGGGYNGGATYYGGGYGGGYYGGGTTTTTIIVPGPTITTTVTEEIVEETTTTTYVSRPRRVYRAPVRHKPRVVKRQCSCSCQCR